jgi:hypothetical protein
MAAARLYTIANARIGILFSDCIEAERGLDAFWRNRFRQNSPAVLLAANRFRLMELF